MRVRRLHKKPAQLEITAFLNLIVVLVPFLLSTAVFTRLAVVNLTLPAQASDAVQKLTGDLQLEVVIRPDALEVGDKTGGLIERIPNDTKGPDTARLSALMIAIKEKFPGVTAASVLAEPQTPYDRLVTVMDAVRAAPNPQAGMRVPDAPPAGAAATVAAPGTNPGASHKAAAWLDLFPDISVGDAPVRRTP